MPNSTPLSLAELNALLPRLQATVEALTGQRHSAQSHSPARRGKRISGAQSAQLRDKLLAALQGKKTGLSLGDLAKKTGAPRNAVGFQLRQLRVQKKARVAGNRGTAKWFANK
jgi:hypothetical protein